MGSSGRNATLRGLLELQKLDGNRSRVQRRLVDGPRLLERRAAEMRSAEERIRSGQERIKKIKTHVAELELELRSREEAIAKLEQQQNASRTNQEYKALGDHMERLRKECSEFEDQVLEGYGQVEATEVEDRSLEEELARVRRESEEIGGQWAKDEIEYRSELEILDARRSEHLQGLAKGPLSLYERVREARDGEVVVPLEGRVCSGCRMRVTPNNLTRLHADHEIITCQSCERILYLAEVYDSGE